jgi:small subunit ribosomal protein S21
MATVYRENGESFDSLFRRFRKTVQQEKILTVTRRRRFFEKPSQVRKRKAAKKRIKSRRTTIKMHRGVN